MATDTRPSVRTRHFPLAFAHTDVYLSVKLHGGGVGSVAYRGDGVSRMDFGPLDEAEYQRWIRDVRPLADAFEEAGDETRFFYFRQRLVTP